jgi:hypothetical protein
VDDGGRDSRLAFLDVCILVAASEGEELVVNVIGGHGGEMRRWGRWGRWEYGGGDEGGGVGAKRWW